MQSNIIYFSELFPNQSTINLNQSSPIVLNNIFGNLNSKTIVRKSTVHLVSALMCGGVARIYYQDGNDEIFLDQTNLNILGGSFDITRYFHLVGSSGSNLIIKLFEEDELYPSISFLVQQSYINIEYINFDETTTSSEELGADLYDSVSYSFNYASDNIKIRKKLFSNILPYDVSIYFDNFNGNEENLLFLKGWKFNLLDYLDINIDNLGNKNITYFDKYNTKHILFPLYESENSNVVVAYYTKDGSALILEEEIDLNNNTIYTLSTKIGNSYKQFDNNGRIIKIQGEKIKQVININYHNGILVEDYRGNEISIQEELNGTLSISLNNDVVYTFYLDNNNQLSSISINNKIDSFSYNNNGQIQSIFHNNVKKLEVSYLGGRVNSINECNGNNVLELYLIEHDYFKTYVTNRHGVKNFYYFDQDLRLISKGENINGVDNVFSLDFHDIEVEDAYFAFSNSQINKYTDVWIFGTNLSFNLNQNSNTLENLQLYAHSQSNIDSFVANKRYILIATLTKNSQFNVPLSSSKEAYITVQFGNNTSERFDFNPYLQKQTIAIPFIAKSSDSPSIKIHARGLYDFGGVTFSDIMIVDARTSASTYYANKKNGDGLTVASGSSSEQIDNLTWYPINAYIDNGTEIIKYSIEELKRNYIAALKGARFFWGNNFTKLIYQSPNNGSGFNFRGNIVSLSNIANATFYAKKTLIENLLFYSKYNFEYLRFNLNQGCFEHTKIYRCNLFTTYKSIKKYDFNLRLIEETDYNNISKIYEYDLDGNVIKIRTKNSNDNKYIDIDFDYDSKLRNISENNGISSTDYNYLDEYDLLEESIDSNNISETFEYSDDLTKLTKVEKTNSEINNLYDNNGSLIKTSNDSEINILYDGFGLESSASVAVGYLNSNALLFNTSRVLGNEDKTVNNGNVFTYNKYGSLKTAGIQYMHPITHHPVENILCEFYYFTTRPNNIEDVDQQDEAQLIGGANLYIVNDEFSDRRTHYTYNLDNAITELEIGDISGGDFDFLYKWTMEYDSYGRLTSTKCSFSSSITAFKWFKATYSYADDVSEMISSVTNQVAPALYTGSLGKTKFSYNRDALLRTANTIHTVFINDNGNWTTSHKFKDIYTYLDLSTNRTTSLVSRVDWKYIHDNSTSSLKSIYYNYNNSGNLSSIRYGSPSVQNNNSGVSYFYDSCDRISSETNIELGNIISYNYDQNGNITSAIKTNISNPNISTTESYIYDSVYKDLLLSFNNKQITYDEKLRPLTFGNNISFCWLNNKLISMVINNNETTFKYDFDGVRTCKASPDGTKHIYVLNGKRIVGEKIVKPDSSVYYITYLYDQNGVYGITYKNKYFTFKRNALGDIDSIYSAKNLIARYIYDAFGNHIIVDKNGIEITDATSVAHINPFRYRGYYYDEETGLYYCNSRYYNPEWRRWISPDDVSNIEIDSIDGINLYAYCKNNPIKYADPNGTFSIVTAIVCSIIGLIVSIASLAVKDALTGHQSSFVEYLITGFFGALTGFLTGGFGPGILSAGICATSSFLESTTQQLCSGDYKSYKQVFTRSFINSVLTFAASCITFALPPISNSLNKTFKTNLLTLCISYAIHDSKIMLQCVLRATLIGCIFKTIESILEYPFKKSAERLIEIFDEN